VDYRIFREYKTKSNMCVLKFKNSDKCKMINRSKLGSALQAVLSQAKVDGRLTCGLPPTVAHLERASEDVLLCVLPLTRPGDAATHIQTVLLQAFCYENYIPVIQVDSSEKLGEYCGLGSRIECPCAIITKDEERKRDPLLSPTEQELTDFYECTLEEFPRPIVELPR
jgi:ribosomal protein L7Ae-like RNA K-turn-binding protein